jgi:hypothetical protein
MVPYMNTTPQPFRSKRVSTRQAYFCLGFFILGFALTLVILLTGGRPFSVPVQLIILGLCVANAIFWVFYIASGSAKDKGRRV